MGKGYQDEQARRRYRDDHWKRVEALLTEIRDLLREQAERAVSINSKQEER